MFQNCDATAQIVFIILSNPCMYAHIYLVIKCLQKGFLELKENT